MKRVRLIHWKAEEAAARVEALSAAGYRVEYEAEFKPQSLRAWGERPPDAFVVDLTRVPSHGRDLALTLRQRRPTRPVPLVFAGGDADKVERVRAALPDAVFTEWARIRGALRAAIARPPERPHVPASVMDAYSGTPLPKKLGVRPEARVLLSGAPEGFAARVGIRAAADGPADLEIRFVRDDAELKRLVRARRDWPVWFAWPKKGSALFAGLTQQRVREAGLAAGLVDYKVCAIDETWSGLLFRRRK